MKRAISISLLILVAMSTIAQARNSSQDATSDPKAQTLKLYLAIQKQDWKSMYFLTLFSTNVRKQMPDDADAFAEGVRRGISSDEDGQKTVNDVLDNLSNITVGDPVVSGDKADVPTSARLAINGRVLVFKGIAHMIKDSEVWKWDLTFSDDTKAATEQAMLALIGKPQ